MDLLAPESLQAAALLSTRLGGLLLTAPVFASRALPRLLRIGMLALLLLALLPVAVQEMAVDARLTPTTLAGEAVVGVVLGMAAGIFVAAAESAGDMLAVQMGLSGANVVDPMMETQLPVLGHFLGFFVLTLILVGGGHLVMLEALTASLWALPPGTVPDFDAGIRAAVGLGSEVFLLGLRFAAPVAAAMMIGNAALGVLARTVPQLNVLMTAFPLQIGIGLTTLSVGLAMIATHLSGWSTLYGSTAAGLLDAFGAGRR